MKKLLSFLALALCFVACQNELGTEVSNSDFVDVVLTVDAPELGVTRADNDGQNEKNSALGAIDFLSDADWANYDLRYILEVYAADDDGTGEPIYRERLVNCLDKYAPTTFALRLVPNRDYKFVVFSDFVAEGNAELTDPAEKLAISDLYYNTADLRNISAITTQPTWGAMNEIRDAYFIAENVTITTTGLNKTLILKRPFAKLRVIAKDLDYITGYSQPGYVEVTYKNEKIYKSFNAVNGELNADEMAGDELKYGYNVSKTIPYNAGYDAKSTNQTLFTDYLFAVEGEQTPVNFEMAVYESKGGRLIHSQDFNTQIPIQRNHLTTIIGDLLTTQANITIEVNDNFEDEFVNSTMTPALPAPKAVGEAKVDGNSITIEWEAVANAANYSVAVNNATPVVVEETTYTFVGEYETSYTIQVSANPADETAFTKSASTVFTATTGEKPADVAYKLYFKNVSKWAKVYAHIWANEGEDLGLEASEWPGRELTETEEVEGVTYYVFQLPAEATGKTVNVVFNDGNGSQTKDLSGVATEDLYFDNYVEPVAPSDVVLYLKPNANWKEGNARFAAYFFGNGQTWVDMTLVEGETDIYAVTVPAGFENIIFCRMNPAAAANNWNNKWNQTGDLKVPTDGKNLFTLAANVWDGATTTWSVYTPVVEPTALATPVVNATVAGLDITLTWEAVENAAQYGITVGTEMPVFVEGTTYTFNATEYETEYTFNVVAVPADEVKFAVSEAAVVTAKTEAAPVVEPEVLAELDADAYYIYKQATEMKGGKWYAIVYENKAATGLTGNYGYLQVTEAASRANGISLPATCAFGFLTTDGGYTIQQFNGKYVYQTGSYDSFNVNANLPADGGVWSVAVEGDEYTITNNAMSKFVQYDPTYNSYGCYATSKGNLPTLYELVEVDNTPAILGVSSSSLSFDANGGSKTATIETYGSATINVSDNADWVSTSLSDNVVTVNAEANSGDARDAVVTITYGDDSVAIAVSQAEYKDPSETPETPENTIGVYTSMDFLFDGKTVSSDKLSPGTNAYKQKMNYDGGTIDVLKLGTSSKAGSYETAAVGVSGKSKLSFYAVGWKGKTVKLTVTVDGKATEFTLKANTGATGNPPYNTDTAALEFNNETDYYTIDVTGITADSTVSFATDSSGCRALICGVQLY